MRLPIFCLAGLLLCASGASSAQDRRYDVMDTLVRAEKADMSDLGRQGQGPQLMNYRSVLQADLRALTSQLQPLFSPSKNGWVDCSQARHALKKSLEIASTTAGLEATVVMGVRVERFHCQGANYDHNSPDWRQGVTQAMFNIQGRLPPSFTQTRAVLSRTTASEVLAAAEARAHTQDNQCLGEELTVHRKKGLRFQDAQRRAIDFCVSKAQNPTG